MRHRPLVEVPHSSWALQQLETSAILYPDYRHRHNLSMSQPLLHTSDLRKLTRTITRYRSRRLASRGGPGRLSREIMELLPDITSSGHWTYRLMMLQWGIDAIHTRWTGGLAPMVTIMPTHQQATTGLITVYQRRPYTRHVQPPALSLHKPHLAATRYVQFVSFCNYCLMMV